MPKRDVIQKRESVGIHPDAHDRRFVASKRPLICVSPARLDRLPGMVGDGSSSVFRIPFSGRSSGRPAGRFVRFGRCPANPKRKPGSRSRPSLGKYSLNPSVAAPWFPSSSLGTERFVAIGRQTRVPKLELGNQGSSPCRVGRMLTSLALRVSVGILP